MASVNYITVNEVQALWRTLTSAEQTKVTALIPYACDYLRQAARNHGQNLDTMIDRGETSINVVKMVCVDMLKRYMNTADDDSPAMSQVSQSALGYSMTGTYLVPGGGWFLKEAEKKALGIKRQRIGVIDLGRH